MSVDDRKTMPIRRHQQQRGLLRLALLVGLAVAASAGAYWLVPEEPASSSAVHEAVAGMPPHPQPKAEAASTPAALSMIDTVAERRLPPPDNRSDRDGSAAPTPSPQAVAALRESMRNGDPRTPPLVRNTDLREPPSAAELADPSQYQQYEARQNQQVRASFVAAVNRKMAELEGLIAEGKAFGIAPEQLEEGIAKLNTLREQRDQLVAQPPELAAEEEAEGVEAAEGAGETSQD